MPAPGKPTQRIRVAVVADSPGTAQQITRTLQESGYAVRPFTLTNLSAYDRVRELRPNVVLLRAGARSLSAASAFARIAANGGPALVLLTPAATEGAIGLAFDSGALVHLVEPVPVQSLTAAISLALARARDLRDLQGQVRGLRESGEARKAVERAKAILMRRLGMTEEDAHRRLQRESRNRNRKLVDTAWHVIGADSQLPRTRQPVPPTESEATVQEPQPVPVESSPTA